MLEELTNHRADVEAPLVAIWIRNEATHAAHDQVNRDAASRCIVQEADHLGVNECVHLRCDVRAPAARCVLNSGADPLTDRVTQLRGCNEEALVVGVL